MRSQMLRFGMALVALTALPLHATAQTLSLCRTRSSKHSIIMRMPRLHSFDSSKLRHASVRSWPDSFLSFSARASVVYLPASKSEFADLGTIESESKTITSGAADLSVDLVNLSALADYLSAPDRTEVQKLETQETRRRLAFAVARQFLTVLATEQVKEAAGKRLEVSGLTVEQAEQRLNAGVGRPSDVTRAQLEQASAESTQISSSRDVTLESLSLGQLLVLRETLPALEAPKQSLIDFDWKSQALKDEALESRLDLRQAKLIIETTSMAIRQNLAGYLPTISAGASVSKSDDGVVERDVQWNVGVNMRWELYSGGYREAEDARLEAEAQAAGLTVDKLTRTIAHEIDVAQKRLEASLPSATKPRFRLSLPRKTGNKPPRCLSTGSRPHWSASTPSRTPFQPKPAWWAAT